MFIEITRKPLFQSDNASLPVKPSRAVQEKFCKPLSEHLYSLVSTYFKKNVYLKDKYEFIAILHLAGRNRRGILDRIVGRRESNIRAWPWVATVIIHDGVFKCGGSLLIETGY